MNSFWWTVIACVAIYVTLVTLKIVTCLLPASTRRRLFGG